MSDRLILDNTYETIAKLKSENQSMREKLEKCKEALEFYGRSSRFKQNPGFVPAPHEIHKIDIQIELARDDGDKAQQTLKQVFEEEV